MSDRRLAALRAALGFLQLAPRARELRLLHRWLTRGRALGSSPWASSGWAIGYRGPTWPTTSGGRRSWGIGCSRRSGTALAASPWQAVPRAASGVVKLGGQTRVEDIVALRPLFGAEVGAH
jgi:hypothetical protein